MAKRRKQPNYIEAKPTEYQGTMFRSRLEARWAVCFDYIPNIIRWEYEPHTFTMPNGWDYTPDYRLTMYLRGTKATLYVECKPKMVADSYHKYLLKATHTVTHPILILISPMYNENIPGTGIRELDIIAGIYGLRDGRIAEHGPANPLEIFDGLPRALKFALDHRFDLKE